MQILRQVEVSLFSLTLVLVPVLSGQTVAPSRDQQATTILSRAVSAMGGSSSLLGVGIVAHGNSVVPPAGISGPILWETQGAEFRYERTGPHGSIIFVSAHGRPAIVGGGNVRQGAIGHLAMNLVPPHLAALVLAKNLANANMQISSMQRVQLDTVSAVKISTADLTDGISAQICKQDWYFDPVSLLPVRVDFLTSDASNALDTVTMTYLFSNYQRVSGVYFPWQVITLFNGQQIEEITFDSIQVGASIPATDFDAPAPTVGGAH